MKKQNNIATAYFRRRTWFRLALIFITLCLWGYFEVSDLFPIKAHDLNYHAMQEIRKRVHNLPFTLAFLGDNKNSPIFNTLVEKLNHDKKLDFAVIGGDLVLYPTRETYASFLTQLNTIQIPTLVLPGNHDVAFDDIDFYYKIFGRFYYAFEVGDAKFILLDDSNETGLGDQQTAWLEKQLKDGLNDKYRFVFMHVPLWDPRDNNSTGVRYAHSLRNADTARQLEDLFVKYKVSVLFCSHIHAFYETTQRGLKTIISGGAGAELVGSDPKHTFYHYVRVTVAAQGVRTEVIPVGHKTPFEGIKKYLNIAGLYVRTLGKIYAGQILLVLFIMVLVTDGWLEFLYHKKQQRIQQADSAARPAGKGPAA